MYQVAIGWWWGIDSPLVRPPSWTWGDCNGGKNDEKNNGKNERLWYKTMEKMGKQWKIWVERLENWYARKNGGKNRERVKWCQVKLIPCLLGHRTAWDHYKMENHPKKYPAAPKIPSSVDTTKYPAWSFQIWHPWQHGTTKMENFLHPTLKYRVAPKYPSLSIPQNTQFGVFLSTSLGFGTW